MYTRDSGSGGQHLCQGVFVKENTAYQGRGHLLCQIRYAHHTAGVAQEAEDVGCVATTRQNGSIQWEKKKVSIQFFTIATTLKPIL